MDAALERRIRHQHGLVTVADLVAGAVSRAALRWQLGRSWRVSLPGVVQTTFTGSLTPEQQLTAASLFAGPHAVLTGWSACHVHGLCHDTGDRRLLFFTPRSLGAKRYQHMVVRRSLVDDPFVSRHGVLRVASAGRSVADATKWCPNQERADALVLEAVQRRMTSVEELTHWLGKGGPHRVGRLRKAIERAWSGAWSVPEAELLELLATSRLLPAALANPALVTQGGHRLLTPDAYLEDVSLAVMVHSRAHHFDVAEWESTIAGDSGLVEHGVTVIGCTPRQLTVQPQALLRRIERTYAAPWAERRPSRVRVLRRSGNRL